MSTKTSIEELIVDIYQFADNPANLIFREFLQKHRISQHRFTVMLKNNEDLLEAYRYAKLAIGIRREKLALDNKLNTNVYRDTQPLYDEDLKSWELEKKKGQLTIEDGLRKLDIIFARTQQEIEN